MIKLKFLLGFFLALIFTACAEDENPTIVNAENSMNSEVSYITSDEAIALALKAKNHYYGKDSRSSFTVEKVRTIGGHQSRGDDNEPLLYIVDFEDNEGCAVICGKRIDDPVLAVTERGHLAYESELDNPGAQFFMERAISYANTKVPQPLDTLTQNYQYLELRTDTVLYWNVPQRIHLAWHQYYPLNQFCPIDANGCQAPTGCGPLATAMAMTYFSHPDYIDLTFPKSNNERLLLDWEGIKCVMPTELVAMPSIDYSFEDYEIMAAKLVREIGHRSDASYSCMGTGVAEAPLIRFIESQGYTCTSSSGMPSLNNKIKSIIMVFALSKNGNHIFLIDGQEYIHTQDYETVYDVVGNGGMIKLYEKMISEYSHNYVHVNWGWGGIDNGYYNAGVLATNKIVTPDKTPTYGNGIHSDYTVDVADYVIITK